MLGTSLLCLMEFINYNPMTLYYSTRDKAGQDKIPIEWDLDRRNPFRRGAYFWIKEEQCVIAHRDTFGLY